jgi:hypothetical protein
MGKEIQNLLEESTFFFCQLDGVVYKRWPMGRRMHIRLTWSPQRSTKCPMISSGLLKAP